MSVIELLDAFEQVGSKLAARSGEGQDGAAADVKNEINASLLPVWQWLDNLKSAADQSLVDWPTLDRAVSEETIDAVKGAIAIISAEIDTGNVAALTSQLEMLSGLLETVADEIDKHLEQAGVAADQRNRLLRPLRTHLSEVALTRGSSEALSIVRTRLGQEAERRLTEGVAKQATYESRRADRFRIGALASFFLSILWLIASFLAFRSPEAEAGAEWIGQAVTRLAIGSAFLALAVYLSREAGQHRTKANEWRSLELQMDTIDLYCASLPPDDRDKIRLAFGLEVFSGSKLFSSVGVNGNGGNGVDGLTGPYERLLSQVRALGQTQRI